MSRHHKQWQHEIWRILKLERNKMVVFDEWWWRKVMEGQRSEGMDDR